MHQYFQNHKLDGKCIETSKIINFINCCTNTIKNLWQHQASIHVYLEIYSATGTLELISSHLYENLSPDFN